MLATVAVAAWLRLGTRPLTHPGAGAAVVCLLDPWAVIAPGFWLSFGAVAAIMVTVGGRPAAREPGWRSRLRERPGCSWGDPGLLPLTAVLFQQVSLVSIAANVMAISAGEPGGHAAGARRRLLVVLPARWNWLAAPCLALAHGLLVALHAFLTVLAAPSWASLALSAPPGWALALALAGVACCWRRPAGRCAGPAPPGCCRCCSGRRHGRPRATCG